MFLTTSRVLESNGSKQFTNDFSQHTQIDGSTLEYDNNGNLKDDDVNTYVYNYANQLLKVTRKSDSKVLGEYKYDALGRRVYKKAWDGAQYIETWFYYDGVRCIEGRNDSDTVIAQYVFGNGLDEVLTMDRNSETYYYHENRLGSIYAVTTATGNVVERYSYDAYGNPSFYDGAGNPIGGTAIGNRLLYTGREYDVETNLYHYRIRGYSATLGRFLQKDPMGYDNLLNLYAYVKNSPTTKRDPLGLQGECEGTTLSYDDIEGEAFAELGGPDLSIVHDDPDNPVLSAPEAVAPSAIIIIIQSADLLVRYAAGINIVDRAKNNAKAIAQERCERDCKDRTCPKYHWCAGTVDDGTFNEKEDFGIVPAEGVIKAPRKVYEQWVATVGGASWRKVTARGTFQCTCGCRLTNWGRIIRALKAIGRTIKRELTEPPPPTPLLPYMPVYPDKVIVDDQRTTTHDTCKTQ